MPGGQLTGQLQGVLQDLRRRQAAGALHGEPGRHPPDPAGHPHHEELIQVAGEDGEEPHPLKQRDGLVLRELQDPLVEPEPALLAIQIPTGRQLVGAGRAGLIRRQGGEAGLRRHLVPPELAKPRGGGVELTVLGGRGRCPLLFAARTRHAARVLVSLVARRCDLAVRLVKDAGATTPQTSDVSRTAIPAHIVGPGTLRGAGAGGQGWVGGRRQGLGGRERAAGVNGV